MPWTIPDHKKSAIDAINLGLITADLAVLAEVPEPFQSNQHQARVSAISILYELGGPAASVGTPWSRGLYDWSPPTEPPVGPPADAIVIPSGVHSGYSVEAEAGAIYWGEPGAVLDGNGDTTYAFHGTADDVRIMNLEIRNFINPNQRGAIDTPGASRWLVKDCDIHHNLGAGVALDGDRHQIRSNRIHHQHQIGIKVRDGDGSLVEGNEISFNNWLQEVKWGWEAGGTKFARNTNLTIRNNHSHDNHGPGLWSDIRNANVLYEGNRVEDNYAAGIFHEIGGDAVIRGNQVRRNGAGHTGWLWGAGIQIANSGHVTIHGNVVEGNRNGICFTDQGRGALSGEIYDNDVTDSGVTGVASDTGSWPVGPFDYRGNRYVGGSFKWQGRNLGLAGWRQYHPDDGVVP